MDATLTAEGGWGIPIGTPVFDAAGEKLGTVREADVYALVVERGFFFVTDHEIALDEVDRLEDGKLVLKRTKAQLLGDGA